jgi:hypothetical protein
MVPAAATNVVAVAAGDYHNLALRRDGKVVAWGDDSFGQASVPAEDTNVVAVAAGQFHSLALRGDGTMVGWGYNSYGQATVPAEAPRVLAIAAGARHSLAVGSSAELLAWGWNGYGQATRPQGFYRDLTSLIVTNGHVDPNTLGSYLLTYTVADSSGNTNHATRMVVVPPVFSFGDGIPDWWRRWYFGNAAVTNHQSCATCDASGTGQNNLFKYVAGLNPTNPASVFVLRVEPVGGQLTRKDLQFSPWASGRAYTPWFTTNLVGGPWSPLAGYLGPITNGIWVRITDTNAAEPRKFYRIEITLP